MTSDTARNMSPPPPLEPEAARVSAPPRLWPPLALVGLFWVVYAILSWTPLGITLGFWGFMVQLITGALVLILFLVWWLASRRLRWAERLGVLGAAIAGGVGAGFLVDRSLGAFLVLPGLPVVLTAWTLALLAVRYRPQRVRRLAVVAALFATWGAFTLIRSDGVGGDGQPELRWRWQPSAESAYLADRESTGGTTPLPGAGPALTLAPGDWPGFRGPNRDGSLPGVRIATDWASAPPRPVWRRPIGPAWSSVAVVGDRLFTQEQVGDLEAVVALDAATGRTLWSHQDAARHWDAQSGVGPRATPTFAGGRLFTLGATGLLNCLDAGSGERLWSRNVAADAGAETPIWGFASSPLVIEGLVVVFAGSDAERGGETEKSPQSEKTLLAYRTDSGQPAWEAPAGKISYSSPQAVAIGGETQILFASELGLTAFEPASGAVIWQHGARSDSPGIPRSVQPRTVGEGRILFDSGPDLGTALLELSRESGAWVPAERWISRQLKPSFNDFVVHGGAIYGFDGRILSSIDLETGQRRWKQGRYGSGQVLLLGDPPLLLVVSESGEVVLVAADPDQHRELGRFQAIAGKTWNHPVIAHGRLYVRNAEEIAAYELQEAAR